MAKSNEFAGVAHSMFECLISLMSLSSASDQCHKNRRQ